MKAFTRFLFKHNVKRRAAAETSTKLAKSNPKKTHILPRSCHTADEQRAPRTPADGSGKITLAKYYA